jgi:hypothetical protein
MLLLVVVELDTLFLDGLLRNTSFIYLFIYLFYGALSRSDCSRFVRYLMNYELEGIRKEAVIVCFR